MRKYYQFIRCFFIMWGTSNWYVGVDKPTLWQRIYGWRISPSSAVRIAKQIWIDKN
jgi:hypothetical protein